MTNYIIYILYIIYYAGLKGSAFTDNEKRIAFAWLTQQFFKTVYFYVQQVIFVKDMKLVITNTTTMT